MKALILAAGFGRRLWPLTAEKPKCLLELDGGTILEHQLRGLRRTKAEVAVIVCGFGVDQVRTCLCACKGELRVRILFNPFYALADNLMSLWTARDELDDDLVLLNGDAVFHPGVFELLDAVRSPCCLLLARRSRYDPDDMKVHVEGERVTAIGKELPVEFANAVSVGALRFSGEGARHLRRQLDESVLDPSALDSHFPAVVQRLVERGHAVDGRDIGDLAWADVDTPADLQYVREHLRLFGDPGLERKMQKEA